ncbi:hypothetical protein BSKO_04927 [Bryopsis sp. KO-2023]|nr:hypothetical protein BSKO_04927 [Bryopsis sp. KO-2023]
MEYCGQEERQLHERLASLESQAFQDTQAISALGAEGTRPQATELHARIKNWMRQMRAGMRELELLGEEQDTEADTDRVRKLIQNHKKQYEGLKRNLESASVQMKKNAEKAWLDNREQLLAGAAEPNHSVQSQQQAVRASQKITESLRRTHEQMTQQIELTDGNLEVLGASTQELVKAKEELQSQEEKFSTAGRLLNSLQRQDTWDKMALWGGVILFSMAVLFIFQKRVLGLTPDIVKSSITSAVSTSFSTLYDLGKAAMKSDATGKDPAEIPNVFDDLADEHDPGDKIGVAHQCGSGQVMVDGACAWIQEQEGDADLTADPTEGRHTADEIREKLRKLKEMEGGDEEDEEIQASGEHPSILKDLEASFVDEATRDSPDVDQGMDVGGAMPPQVETLEGHAVVVEENEAFDGVQPAAETENEAETDSVSVETPQEHPQNEMGDGSADPAEESVEVQTSLAQPGGGDSPETQQHADEDDEYDDQDDDPPADGVASSDDGGVAEAEPRTEAPVEADQTLPSEGDIAVENVAAGDWQHQPEPVGENVATDAWQNQPESVEQNAATGDWQNQQPEPVGENVATDAWQNQPESVEQNAATGDWQNQQPEPVGENVATDAWQNQPESVEQHAATGDWQNQQPEPVGENVDPEAWQNQQPEPVGDNVAPEAWQNQPPEAGGENHEVPAAQVPTAEISAEMTGPGDDGPVFEPQVVQVDGGDAMGSEEAAAVGVPAAGETLDEGGAAGAQIAADSAQNDELHVEHHHTGTPELNEEEDIYSDDDDAADEVGVKDEL